MKYLKIVLRSDLCAGNGESVGNAVDTDVCMDGAGLPYIPARRLKGCLREAARELDRMGYAGASEVDCGRLFGDAYGNEGCLFVQDAVIKEAGALREFLTQRIPSDDRIPTAVKRSAHPVSVERLFASVRGQTGLEEGVKVDNSLRFTRVISHYDPFESESGSEMAFYAPVYLDADDPEMWKLLKDCCRATRHIGSSRNRGLGNVSVSLYPDDKPESKRTNTGNNAEDCCSGENQSILERLQPSDDVTVSYRITLDAPVTLPGCDELNTSIPARSVIGCLAGNYLRRGSAEDGAFRSLFLNGDVRWSALTPVIDGITSDPVPMMLVRLKNGNGRMVNHLLEETDEWKKLKPRTMDGAFASIRKLPKEGGNEYLIAEPPIHTVYHNALHATVQDSLSGTDEGGRMLYMQDSIDAGMVYGGTVSCKKEMAEEVLRCLKTSEFRFGRSRSAQYAACRLNGDPSVREAEIGKIPTTAGERVYVILKSDLAMQKDGRYVTDEAEIRQALAEELNLPVDIPGGRQDYCRYHTIGGYQAVWQLQKPQVPVVRAGSVYCFQAVGGELPALIRVGEFPQEGFGVCVIETEETMPGKATKGEIDCAEPEKGGDSRDRIKTVYRKLLAAAGLEAMKRYALDFEFEERNLPVGRLRLMLSESEDIKDLLRMIGAIKESDRSSENEVTRKKTSENLVKKLYAVDGKNEISFERMLQLEEGLWEELRQDEEAVKLLERKWKVPLEIILHRQHYRKER